MGQDLGQNLAESGSLLGWVCDAGLGSVLGLGPVPGPGSDPSRSRSCPAVGGQRRGYDSRVYGGQQQPQYWGQPGNRGVRIPGHSGGTSGPCWGTSRALPISKPLPDQFLTLLGLAGHFQGCFGRFGDTSGHARDTSGHGRGISGALPGIAEALPGLSQALPGHLPFPNHFLTNSWHFGAFWGISGPFQAISHSLSFSRCFLLVLGNFQALVWVHLNWFLLVWTGLNRFEPFWIGFNGSELV